VGICAGGGGGATRLFAVGTSSRTGSRTFTGRRQDQLAPAGSLDRYELPARAIEQEPVVELGLADARVDSAGGIAAHDGRRRLER